MPEKYAYKDLLEKIKSLERLASDSRQAERNLVKERDFSKILIDASPAFFVAISAERKTLMMNPAMLTALGYTEEEVLGTDYLSTFAPAPDHPSLVRNFEKRLTSDKPTTHENHVITVVDNQTAKIDRNATEANRKQLKDRWKRENIFIDQKTRPFARRAFRMIHMHEEVN